MAFKILAIDGGGIRGVIPAVLLTHIERITRKPTAELFDLIVGTSTGAILSAGLTVKESKTSRKPRYSAQDMLELYTERGHEIFRRSFWRGVTSPFGINEERYDHGPLERILKKYLGEDTLTDCLVDVVMPSYDIERREPYFFKSRRAREKKDRNHLLWQSVRAATAAPTFFEPAKVTSLAQRGTTRYLIDGGVFVNNPAMTALVEAISLGRAADDTLVVSLGTGIATRKIAYEDAKGWGLTGWVRPIIDVMMDGAADAADYQLAQMIPDKAAGDDQRYFRFDKKLTRALDDMDAAHRANIDALRTEAEEIIATQGPEFFRLEQSLAA